MECPDENLLARVQARKLTAEEAAAYQHHLDGCPACLEIAMVLGCIADSASAAFHPPATNEERGSPEQVFTKALPIESERRDQRRALFPLLAMVVGHGYWSFVFVPLAWKTVCAERHLAAGITVTFELAFALYALIWGTLGLGWSGLILVAVNNGWKRARRLVSAYAILSGPSVALIPLGLCMWLNCVIPTELFISGQSQTRRAVQPHSRRVQRICNTD